MISAHYDAVFARLQAEPVLAGKGYDSIRVDSAGGLVRDTYWVLFGGTPDELGDDRLTGSQTATSDATFVYTVRSVSPSAAAARGASSRGFAQLVGFRPTIAGRVCQPITHSRADDVEPDTSVYPPLFFTDDEYELRTTRA